MRTFWQRLFLVFEDPIMEQLYAESNIKLSRGLIVTNLILDLVMFGLVVLGNIYSTVTYSQANMVTIGLIVLLYLLTLFCLKEFRCRSLILFAIMTTITLLSAFLLIANRELNLTRLLLVHYIITSAYRTLKSLNSFILTSIFNFIVAAFIVIALYATGYRLFDNFLDGVAWLALPAFYCLKDWKIKAAFKENCRSQFKFKTIFDNQNRLMENNPVGLMLAESNRVIYQSSRARTLLECSSAEQALNSLSEIKLHSNNIDFEKNIEEDHATASNAPDSDRTLLNSNLSHSLKSVQSNLSLLGFLKLFLDSKFFRPNWYVEIPNAIYRQKSLDIFVTSGIKKERMTASIVIIDSTIKNKKVFMEESDKYKTRVLGYISHSLKNPIHSIRDSLFKLQAKLGDNDQFEEIIAVGLINCQLVAEMPNYIQTLTDLINNKLIVEKGWIAIRPLLKSLVAESQKNKPKMLQLTCTVSDEVPEMIYTSSKLLSIVLKNLVNNSKKHTMKGYVNISIEPATTRFNSVKVTIKDTGRGFPKDHLTAIVKELYEPSSVFTKFSEINVGVGLKLCHLLSMILSPDGEHFEISSEEDQGTTCSFLVDIDHSQGLDETQNNTKTLYVDDAKGQQLSYTVINCPAFHQPVFEQDDESADDAILQKNEELRSVLLDNGPEFKSMTDLKHAKMSDNSIMIKKCPFCFDVLIVDDDLMNLSLLEDHLKDANWRVKQAYNGKEALSILRSECLNGHPYHQQCKLIITDVEMPEMGGIELLAKIRDLQYDGILPTVPVVANTANIVELGDIQEKGENFDQVIPKPFYKEDMLQIVHQLVGDAVKYN